MKAKPVFLFTALAGATGLAHFAHQEGVDHEIDNYRTGLLHGFNDVFTLLPTQGDCYENHA